MNRKTLVLCLTATLCLSMITQNVLAQISPEADRICRSECYERPTLQLLVPDGEPLRVESTDGGVNLVIHSKKDSTEWVAFIPATQGTTFEADQSVRYGERIKIKKEGRADGECPSSIEKLIEYGSIMGIPNPTMEKTQDGKLLYAIRLKWAQRDSLLTPYTESQGGNTVNSKDLLLRGDPGASLLTRTFPSGLYVRHCSDCNKWWDSYLERTPEPWKGLPIEIMAHKDFQTKDDRPAPVRREVH